MEYIRIKGDGYEIITTFAEYDESRNIATELGLTYSCEIIKQSDNPEDLCDEFVWVTPEGEHRIKPKTGDALWYLCCDYKQGHQIYGAIWTDKGLSYVMKMNDIGKWELL